MCDQMTHMWVANGEEIDGLSGSNRWGKLVIIVLLAKGEIHFM